MRKLYFILYDFKKICDVTTTDYGSNDDFNATDVPPSLEVDVYDVNGADEPENEYIQFNSTDFDNSTDENVDWNEL